MKQIYLLLFCLVLNFAVVQQQDNISDHLIHEPQEIIFKLKNDISSGVSYNYMGVGLISHDIDELLQINNKLKSSKVLHSDSFVSENLIFSPDTTLNINHAEAESSLYKNK